MICEHHLYYTYVFSCYGYVQNTSDQCIIRNKLHSNTLSNELEILIHTGNSSLAKTFHSAL